MNKPKRESLIESKAYESDIRWSHKKTSTNIYCVNKTYLSLSKRQLINIYVRFAYKLMHVISCTLCEIIGTTTLWRMCLYRYKHKTTYFILLLIRNLSTANLTLDIPLLLLLPRPVMTFKCFRFPSTKINMRLFTNPSTRWC